MANRDSNELLAASFQEASTVNLTNLHSLLSHMIGQIEEMKSQQVAQHKSLERQINQNQEDFQKYLGPDQYVEEVRALREEFQRYPDPEMLNQCVTWDAMQSALLSETESLRKEFLNSGPLHPGAAQTEPTSNLLRN